MALVKGSKAKASPFAPKNVDKAPFWVNATLKDVNGNVHNLPRGLPGSMDNQVLRSMYAAEMANRAAYDEWVKTLDPSQPIPNYVPKEFILTARVSIPNPDADKDLLL